MSDEERKQKLLRDLRKAQRMANEPCYARAFGFLERAVATFLGVTCIGCGLASAGEDRWCDSCRKRREAEA